MTCSIYHKVIETAGGIPVLVRGGGRVSDQEILERTKACWSRARAASSMAATSSSTRTRRHHPRAHGDGA